MDTKTAITYGVLGTVFTWFLTALGAAVVFLVPSNISPSLERKILDGSLGFSAGVMLAASFWSLLLPAIELGEGQFSEGLGFIPAMIGFLLGCAVVQASDYLLPDPSDFSFVKTDKNLTVKTKERKEKEGNGLRQRKNVRRSTEGETIPTVQQKKEDEVSSKRLMLLIVAMTIHNFPEGLAVGVAFGSIPYGKSTLSQAIVLTLAIGLQNFPEGLAVSLPLQRQTGSKKIGFFWGQLSGSVELLGGFIGASIVEFSEQILPYALGFAAGAMIFVVIDSIIPESQAKGNRYHATWGAIVGFLVMMVLDVSLG